MQIKVEYFIQVTKKERIQVKIQIQECHKNLNFQIILKLLKVK